MVAADCLLKKNTLKAEEKKWRPHSKKKKGETKEDIIPLAMLTLQQKEGKKKEQLKKYDYPERLWIRTSVDNGRKIWEEQVPISTSFYMSHLLMPTLVKKFFFSSKEEKKKSVLVFFIYSDASIA